MCILKKTMTDTRQIVDSFALSQNFASMGVTTRENSLLPRKYNRVPTPYMKQNRRQPFSVAYGDEGVSYEFQESLQIVQSAFLKVTLPAHSINYKKVPGLHIIKTVSLRSTGDLVYQVDYQTLLLEHLQSLSDEDVREYSAAFLGDVGSPAQGSRDVYLPLPLPNSPLWYRGGRSNGVMPWQSFKNNTIRMDFDFYANDRTSTVAAPSPPLSGGEILIKECIVPLSQINNYKNARANFSTISRRFTEVKDWTTAEADTQQDITVSNLNGCVTQIIVHAIPFNSQISEADVRAPVTPSKVQLIADSIKIIDQPNKSEARLIEYSHGFKRNELFSGQTYRLCFSSHGSEDDDTFVGAMNFSYLSECQLRIEFDEKVHYKIVAVQLVRTDILPSGRLKQTLNP